MDVQPAARDVKFCGSRKSFMAQDGRQIYQQELGKPILTN